MADTHIEHLGDNFSHDFVALIRNTCFIINKTLFLITLWATMCNGLAAYAGGGQNARYSKIDPYARTSLLLLLTFNDTASMP